MQPTNRYGIVVETESPTYHRILSFQVNIYALLLDAASRLACAMGLGKFDLESSDVTISQQCSTHPFLFSFLKRVVHACSAKRGASLNSSRTNPKEKVCTRRTRQRTEDLRGELHYPMTSARADRCSSVVVIWRNSREAQPVGPRTTRSGRTG